MTPSALLALAVPLLAQSSVRSQEVVYRKCVSDLAVSELTLFGDGTVRVRETVDDRKDMLLAELNPDEMQAYLARLRDLDLLEAESSPHGVEGAWVGQCSVRLRLDDEPERFYRYGSYDSLALGLHDLVLIVADLEQLARTRSRHGDLPEDYVPTAGDFVRRRDGAVFEVIGYTGDNRGIELSGLEQPITVYVSVDDFRSVFVALEDKPLNDIDF